MKAAADTGCQREVMAQLGKTDRWFLLLYVLNRWDANRDFIYDRCREVEADPDGYIDLWCREHYKSTLITTCGILQGLINNVENTYCILSVTRPSAKSHMRVVKIECEMNVLLSYLWPDVFWKNPKRDAPKWSEDDGLIFKRKGNPNAANVEAWGVIDGQPTGKHFKYLIFNDVQTLDNNSPPMIRKTIKSWETATNLGVEDGPRWYEGTFYAFHDFNMEVIQRGAAVPRIYPATHDGTIYGKPVLWTQGEWERRLREQSPMSVACQLLLDPKQGKTSGFEVDWLRYWHVQETQNLKRIIFCDPAKKKNRTSDFCVFWVLGYGADRNWYALDIVRDKLDLSQRTAKLFQLHQRWNPHHIFYEEYGLQSDIEHFEEIMDRENYRFHVESMGGQIGKYDRIDWLYPLFRNGQFFLPDEPIPYINWEGTRLDMVKTFVREEYIAYPFGPHDDMIDCLARCKDPALHILPPEGSHDLESVLSSVRARDHDEAAYNPY